MRANGDPNRVGVGPSTGSGSHAIGPESFAEPAKPAKPSRRHGKGVELHICPSCSSDLVYPVSWRPADPGSWWVTLRCPACEWHGDGAYAQEVVDRFDEALDDGTANLLADLRMLTRANMEEYAERFIAALNAGALLPEDF